MSEQTGDERREYFRIDDAVRLSIRKVPEEQIEELLQRLEYNIAGNFTVMSGLAAISAEMAVSMRRIEHESPDVAAYLKALDRKIEVLGRAFTAQESNLLDESAHPVNLSAGGMAMLVNECYPVGSAIEVKMLLFPSLTGVLTYGHVVACERLQEAPEKPGYTHQLRVEFTHMREQDRDILIRHVLRCQSLALRKD
jgi:c-di-GMP-binding flagellar brake protein YcgR